MNYELRTAIALNYELEKPDLSAFGTGRWLLRFRHPKVNYRFAPPSASRGFASIRYGNLDLQMAKLEI